MSQIGASTKPTLLVVDIQNAWLDENADLKKSVEKRIGVINEAIGWFRRNELPIVVIYHADKETGTLPGTEPFEFIHTVSIEDSDIKITKEYPNAFRKTLLETTLKSAGCDTVIIAGLSASGCVLATFFGALDHDLNPYLLEGGVASHSEEHVRFAEEICATISPGSFDKELR